MPIPKIMTKIPFLPTSPDIIMLYASEPTGHSLLQNPYLFPQISHFLPQNYDLLPKMPQTLPKFPYPLP